MQETEMNSKKATFFDTFYNVRTFQGYRFPEQIIRIASKKAGLKVSEVRSALQEILDHKLDALESVTNYQVVVFFKINVAKMAHIVDEMLAVD